MTNVLDSGMAARAGHRLVTVGAWAGIVGPTIFAATFLSFEAYLGDRYDRVSEVVSALEAGPYGWVQQLNFAVFGVLTIVFAVGLHRGLRPSPRGLAGPALMAVSGVGALLAAALPLREDAAGVTYDPGGHIVAGLMFFSTSALSLVLLSRRLAVDPRWHGLAGYTLGAGIIALASFVALGIFVMPDGAPMHEYAGLAQRGMVLLILFPCRLALGARLLRVARQTVTAND
jgi:hypothetical membrane protein